MSRTGIDEQATFVPARITIVTVSDTRTVATDSSGRFLVEAATRAGHAVTGPLIVPDEQDRLEQTLRACIDDPQTDIVIATGGTGVTGRDVTPEAFHAVYDKHIPGFGELFRALSYRTIGTSTIQSRATAGVARNTYLFALPGSTSACRQAWEEILQYQLDSRHRPCNFIELLPRLSE